MTRLLIGCVLVSSLTMAGCNASSPGGPGIAGKSNSSGVSNTTITTYKPRLGETENSFRLSGPTLATHIKQGDIATAQVTISRGSNFQDDVRLKMAALPDGVTMEIINPSINHSETGTTIEFRATPEAIPGTYTVSVIGEPSSGPDAKSDFQITVDKRQ